MSKLEDQARRRLNVYTMEELREEVIMEHSLKLMNNMLCKIRSEGREEVRVLEREREKQKEAIYHVSPPCISDIHI